MVMGTHKKRNSEREAFTEKIFIETSAESSGVGKCEALCTDISGQGLGLTAECRLEKAQIIKLYLSVEKAKTALPVFAEVIWAQPVNERIRAGLRFLI